MLTFRYPVSLVSCFETTASGSAYGCFREHGAGIEIDQRQIFRPSLNLNCNINAHGEHWRVRRVYLLAVNCDQSVQRAQARSVAWSARVDILAQPSAVRPPFLHAESLPRLTSVRARGGRTGGRNRYGLSRACVQGRACRVQTAPGLPAR